MSISSELLTLQNTKTAIRTAINNKGGSVGASDTFASYATAIDNLPSGGSGNPLLTSIDVSEFSGTTFNAVSNYITSATIPSGVTSLGTRAFSDCTGLTSVTIPNGVTSIGNSSFNGCSNLTSLSLPSSVRTIGEYAFQGCSSLTSINIPNGVTRIETNTFVNCTSLTSITIPSSVTVLATSAFYGCSGLTSVTIPSSVIGYGTGVFTNCTSLTSIIVLATTPTTLGSGVFNNTNNCPIYVPAESVAAYKAASGWSTYASRIYPITQVATVDGNPVYNYDLGMTSTDSITSENMAKMPAGTSLELAEGITWAGGATAFSNYTNLTLPSTFATFGDQNMLDGLTTVTSKATTPPSAERNQIGGSSLTAIYVPASAVDTYKANAAWSGFASIIQAISSGEHALVSPETVTLSIENDIDPDELTATIPFSLFYTDGVETDGNTYIHSSGHSRVFTVNAPYCILDDEETEPQCEITTDDGLGLMIYFDSWEVAAGDVITAEFDVTLPSDYAEEDGTWVKQHDQEQRTGTMTITLTA